jgi:hypothetical protein
MPLAVFRALERNHHLEGLDESGVENIFFAALADGHVRHGLELRKAGFSHLRRDLDAALETRGGGCD